MIDADSRLHDWRTMCALLGRQAAASTRRIAPWDPTRPYYRVSVNFFIQRPKTTKYPAHPAVKPDVDKLLRSVFDAITEADLWPDDSHAIDVQAQKHWTDRFSQRTVVSLETIE
jgi:Holliday junction resolvase RusA-like endonuclease